MLNVVLYQDEGKRSRHICLNMFTGINRIGDKAIISYADSYNGKPTGDVAIFYGLRGKLKQIFNDYKDSGKKAILIDLGYWDRVKGGKLEGYHKVVVNSYHPTDYMQKVKHDSVRLEKLKIVPKKFSRRGDHILLAGMSAKSAWANDLQPLEYEHGALKKLKAITKRQIIYRPKPTWADSKPIPGAGYSPGTESLSKVLHNCWAVVTHHSNVSIDALLSGIPVFVHEDSPASLLSDKDLNDIENPYCPDQKSVTQWMQDLSYQQWTPKEMQKGTCWSYLKETGLV